MAPPIPKTDKFNDDPNHIDWFSAPERYQTAELKAKLRNEQDRIDMAMNPHADVKQNDMFEQLSGMVHTRQTAMIVRIEYNTKALGSAANLRTTLGWWPRDWRLRTHKIKDRDSIR